MKSFFFPSSEWIKGSNIRRDERIIHTTTKKLETQHFEWNYAQRRIQWFCCCLSTSFIFGYVSGVFYREVSSKLKVNCFGCFTGYIHWVEIYVISIKKKCFFNIVELNGNTLLFISIINNQRQRKTWTKKKLWLKLK